MRSRSYWCYNYLPECHRPLPVWDAVAKELDSGGAMAAIYASRNGILIINSNFLKKKLEVNKKTVTNKTRLEHANLKMKIETEN